MKEQDIRNREKHNKYLELVTLDLAKIFSDRSIFIVINCPACKSKNYSLQFNKSGFTYVQCNDCDTLFVNPRPSLDNLMKFYKDSQATKFWIDEFFKPMADSRREKIFRPRAKYITSIFPRRKGIKIADIGSGFGIFIEELKYLWPDVDITVIEPSADMANICRWKDLKVIESMLENINSGYNKFDLLTAFELLEHVQEPFAFIQKMFDLLNPGGYIFMTMLNGLGFDIQLFWEMSKSVFPPHHLNFFNPSSIAVLLKRLNFEIIEISTPGELDWDIVESGYLNDNLDLGRFFKTVTKYGTDESKAELQSWIKKHNFSSHMRVIARRPS